MLKVIVIGVLITFLAIFAFTTIDPNVNNGNSQDTQLVSEQFNSITVTGQVNRPGTYVLEDGATMDDLLIAAGGPTSNADANAYLETTLLIKGNSYYIAPLYDESDICGDTVISKVNVNYDSKEQLMAINGFGSATVSAIIDYRNLNGSFTYLEEIKLVSGIGNATFEKVKSSITLR
ncbi:MAG: helix-hairpin-helix domain-containing protein [Bacilli bacterium]|jgi:competence protein ComEA